MAVLLETSVGDLVIDLDLEGSPVLCRNFLKLCKARYYTQTLVHHVVPNRFVVLGDPTGIGHGGMSFFGLLKQSQAETTTATTAAAAAAEAEKHRFLASSCGRRLSDAECREKGRVVAVELFGMKDTVGSQFLITTTNLALEGYRDDYRDDSSSLEDRGQQQQQRHSRGFLSLGKVVEDENHLLDRWADCYIDSHGRPYADWRIRRALIIHDPFDDPRAMKALLQKRGVILAGDDDNNNNEDNNRSQSRKHSFVVQRSPSPVRPDEETVPLRIPIEEVAVNPNKNNDDDEDEANLQAQEEQFRQEIQRKEDKSRAVVLELTGDLPDADITAPENVLFICKLNPITTDEDLQLILSRFDEQVQVDIVRDLETGQSLQYAFAEFTTPQQATQAYLKMNQTLVDDRRIIVDFSQSVAKLWDRHRQRYRTQQPPRSAAAAAARPPPSKQPYNNRKHAPPPPPSDSRRKKSRHF